MQAARHAARQLAQRGATQLKTVRGMASDASSEKAHFDEAMKEMSKWCVGIVSSTSDEAFGNVHHLLRWTLKQLDCMLLGLMLKRLVQRLMQWHTGGRSPTQPCQHV